MGGYLFLKSFNLFNTNVGTYNMPDVKGVIFHDWLFHIVYLKVHIEIVFTYYFQTEQF